MKKVLVIVESPSKMKTIKKFLGSNFTLASSVGHIRDLPVKEFGIDFDNDFEPKYEPLSDKKDVIANLKKETKKADIVYLATDPDREGEAIAWHIAALLPKNTKIKRTAFHSITKKAVLEAIENPREINLDLVNAQQARRILDRMVGYSISPILTRRVKRGRDGSSAGRVQSVALKEVVDREKEIEAFQPVEYWIIKAELKTQEHNKTFLANLYSVGGKKVGKEEGFLIPDEKTAKSLTKKLDKAIYSIDKVNQKEKKRNPVPPFITSTLQQEASRHYAYPVSRTMSIAQQLYEGIDMGSEGTEGLITYMRTDSVQVAPEAITESRAFIKSTYGKEYLPKEANIYKSKKAAQEAHEAIRPTNLNHPPEEVKKYLSPEQYKIYLLVWRRFIASQMNPAIYDTVSLDIATNVDMVLRATGSIIKFRGFLAAYEEKEDTFETKETESILPPVKEKDPLNLIDLISNQSFTKPPPRFTEASLIKELEKSGVGRPSTFASIMNKIQSREYTTKENQALRPTELGRVIAEMLESNFAMIMNIGFTAKMEDELEQIARHKKDWKQLIRSFWEEFHPLIEKAEKDAIVPKILTDMDCPKCGKKVQKIWSRSKYFYGCSNYPDCDYTTTQEALEFNKDDYDENFNWDQKCPNCSDKMILRHGRFGPFLGCSKYPDCKGIINIPKKGEEDLKPEDRPSCPAIGCDGKIMMRRSRFGKIFFSCSNFPDCSVIVNNLDDLSEKYKDKEKTPYEKKARGKRTQAVLKLSKELADLVGEKELSRQMVLKKIWEYIKEHKCQDPKNGRIIVPDAKLSKVIGKNPIDMMKLASVIKDHIIK